MSKISCIHSNYRNLLMANSANHLYYFKILEVHGINIKDIKTTKLSEDEQKKAKEVLEEYEKKLPKTNTH